MGPTRFDATGLQRVGLSLIAGSKVECSRRISLISHGDGLQRYGATKRINSVGHQVLGEGARGFGHLSWGKKSESPISTKCPFRLPEGFQSDQPEWLAIVELLLPR